MDIVQSLENPSKYNCRTKEDLMHVAREELIRLRGILKDANINPNMSEEDLKRRTTEIAWAGYDPRHDMGQ